MRPGFFVIATATALVTVGLVGNTATRREARSVSPAAAVPAEARQKLARLPIPFLANQGQVPSAVMFYTPTFGGTVSIMRSGEMVYGLIGDGPRQEDVITERFAGAHVTTVRGEERSPTTFNVFRGRDASQWRSNVAAFERVSFGDVYDGIGVHVRAFGSTIEKVFTVAPGANPTDIRVQLQGARGLAVTEAGELAISMAGGDVRFSAPVAFQVADGQRTRVPVAYAVDGDEYGFRLGPYDRSRELVIDPVLAATYLGGETMDQVWALAVDPSGSVYATGHVRGASNMFPGVGPGSADATFVGSPTSTEAFVVKLNSDLTSIVAATFIGGSSSDEAWDIAIDPSGTVFVAGQTESLDFPGIGPGSADGTFGGPDEGFVVRLDSSLSAIQGATYLGGTLDEAITAIAVDTVGNVFVGGYTQSSDFPGITNASADATKKALSDAFVARLDAALSGTPNATFLGGSDCEGVATVAVDPAGQVYAAGFTRSKSFSGVSAAAADSSYLGDSEAFVTRLDPMMTSAFTTYLGGGGDFFFTEIVTALAFANGSVYAAGTTGSQSFPGVTSNSADPAYFDGEAFVAQLSPDLTTLQAATYVGGGFWDWANDMTITNGLRVVIAGGTRSNAAPEQAVSSPNPCQGGAHTITAFTASLNITLTSLLSFDCIDRNGEATSVAADGHDSFVGGYATDDWFLKSEVDATAADPTTDVNEGFVLKLGNARFAKKWFVAINLLSDFLIRCRCVDEVALDALVQKLDMASKQAARGNFEAATQAMQQFIAMTERFVRSGDLDAANARALTSQAEQIAELLTPAPRGRSLARQPRAADRARAIAKSCACTSQGQLPPAFSNSGIATCVVNVEPDTRGSRGSD